MNLDAPPPIDFRSPTPPPREPVIRSFLAGLLGGTAISFIVWWVGWYKIDRLNSSAPLIIVLAIKVFGAIGLIASGKWRAAGIGLLISLPLGALIFIGSCFAHFHY